MQAAPAFVSVIIPTFNQHTELARCLAALSRQTYPAHRFEVIVVDNNSKPPLAYDDVPHGRLVREKKPGSYAARNRGILTARGDVLAFTDADCVPRADWIEQGVAAVECIGSLGIVGGRIDTVVRDLDRPTTAELVDAVLAFPQERYIRAGFAATANLFTTRATFDLAGLFDEALLSGGDADWGDRVRQHDRPIVYAADARVAHDARHTLRALWRKSRRVAGGVQQMARRRGTGTRSIATHAKQQLIQLRKIRANLHHQHLRTLRRKVNFVVTVWCVDLLQTIERCRVQFGGTAWRH
jgi:GT2 family glycosyltransferase